MAPQSSRCLHSRTDAERDDIAGDWVKALLNNTIDREPGTVFKYDSGATHLLAAIVEKVSGKPLMAFLKEHPLSPSAADVHRSTVNSAKAKLMEDGHVELYDGRYTVADPFFAQFLRMA